MFAVESEVSAAESIGGVCFFSSDDATAGPLIAARGSAEDDGADHSVAIDDGGPLLIAYAAVLGRALFDHALHDGFETRGIGKLGAIGFGLRKAGKRCRGQEQKRGDDFQPHLNPWSRVKQVCPFTSVELAKIGDEIAKCSPETG